jgi:hypothetical protein
MNQERVDSAWQVMRTALLATATFAGMTLLVAMMVGTWAAMLHFVLSHA